ncbi:hypothetical protein BG28_04665 [Nesterenkonia sp. AN1]|uniref:Uncharacterized protein n=1 Tax=Nesterenkonia aurantiaca TaxID=1436010 RepID=A0A4R7FVZ5_9MICC|nr:MULTISPECIES: hypothetical protein [Nesterenkonia]EXF24729.1 hypothetical protein BG28_04665 [Nesterenkonia sp. AN1]TDS82949.1 hypothetical protein EV640_11216 [Nesterenkonia aurantiaca]
MTHREKDVLLGATFGLAVLVVSEAVRHLLGHDRSLGEMAWSLWIIPFGAIMWSIGGSARRSRALTPPDGAEAGRPSA